MLLFVSFQRTWRWGIWQSRDARRVSFRIFWMEVSLFFLWGDTWWHACAILCYYINLYNSIFNTLFYDGSPCLSALSLRRLRATQISCSHICLTVFDSKRRPARVKQFSNQVRKKHVRPVPYDSVWSDPKTKKGHSVCFVISRCVRLQRVLLRRIAESGWCSNGSNGSNVFHERSTHLATLNTWGTNHPNVLGTQTNLALK